MAHLRKVGGSVMVAIPPAYLEALQLSADKPVEVMLEDDRIVIKPRGKPRYTLDQLMAQCDPDAPFTAEEREWLAIEPVGRELI